MKFLAFARSKRTLRYVSLTVMLAFAASVAGPSGVRAEAENSWFWQKKQKSAAAGAGTGHSQSSGTAATTETAILNDGSAAAFVTADSPAQIQAMADKYAKIVADGGWPEVPRGRLKKGSKGKGAASLNKRLYIEGYLQQAATEGEYAELVTSATEDALKRFQYNHGLAVTGVIDGPTLAALNVPASQRLATIRANIPRFAEYSKDLGSRYIVVNVPAQQIETVNDGKVYSLHNAIVGRPSRPTPVVMTPLTVVRFNPYWNAPASIVEKDIVPRMSSKKPSQVLNEMNIKVFDGVGGPEVDPDKINWRRVRVDDYHFRQEPGGANAMATAKIEFLSPFGIYLHDTPEPHLFKTGSRFYSSGCVRVEKVAILLDWILQGQDGIDQARIAQLAENNERLDVNIANAPQLRVAYLTAWPAKDGVVAFRRDVYGLDGSGFVVGQPLPEGEKIDGKPFVLKPLPRLQEDIDVDTGNTFAALFRRDKNEVAQPGQNKKNDSLVTLKSSSAVDGKQKQAQKAKKGATANTAVSQKWRGLNKDSVGPDRTAQAAPKSDPKAKKKATKKPVDSKVKATTAAKKTADGKPVKTAAADPKATTAKATTATASKKPAEKATAAAATAAKTPANTATAAAAGTKKPADTTAAAKKPATAAAPAKKTAAECKPGADGKLPSGCPAPAKKPVTDAGKTASTSASAAN